MDLSFHFFLQVVSTSGSLPAFVDLLGKYNSLSRVLFMVLSSKIEIQPFLNVVSLACSF